MLIGPWVQQLLIRRPFLRNLLHKLFSGNQPLLNQSFASASVCARLETRSSSIVTGLLSGSAIVLLTRFSQDVWWNRHTDLLAVFKARRNGTSPDFSPGIESRV